jgi:oxygen-dependent protoporphyrinogen oxidase
VVGIAQHLERGSRRFELRTRQRGSEQVLITDRLVLAVPADVCGALLHDISPAFEPVLSGIEYAPVAVASLGYRREDVGQSLDGFGFLAPRSSGLRVLGCVWNSSLFPDRAPTAHVLLTSFVGGATDPAATALSTAELAATIHRELTPFLQIRNMPVFSRVQIYSRALPQYNVGHGQRLRALEKLRAEHPTLSLIGNYLQGPAIGTCIELALATAERVIAHSESARLQRV